jgi:hypothetical protein
MSKQGHSNVLWVLGIFRVTFRLNTILFDLTAAGSDGLFRPNLVQCRILVMNGQTV